MEDLVYMLALPAFFLLICLTFIALNNLYICYYKRKDSENKFTHNVSVLNISNIANNLPPSPTWKRKSRKGLKILRCIRAINANKNNNNNNNNSLEKGNNNNNKRLSLDPCFYPSSVIVLHDSEPPPSYQSLFDNPHYNGWQNKGNQGEQQSPNHWLHPNSAYSPSDSAVLYL